MTATNRRIILVGAKLMDSKHPVDLLIDDGCIRAVTETGKLSAEGGDRFELNGRMIVPGLVDLRARLTTADEMAAAAAGGISHAVLPPDTRRHMDDAVEVRDLLQGLPAGIGVHWVGAWTRSSDADALSDMATLQGAGCFAVGCGSRWVPNGLVMRSAMQYAADLGLKLFITPRDLASK